MLFLTLPQEKLEAKDAEIAALSRIRKDVDSELEELTASLFEEAHKMVRQANVKQVGIHQCKFCRFRFKTQISF